MIKRTGGILRGRSWPPAYYRHSDWLGSSRLTSTQGRALYSSTAYAPFGEQYKLGGASDPSFTGQNADTATSLYDFTFREHSPSQGRWISPDPAGVAAVDPTNPQSWNRYAYVLNNPLALVDPLGLEIVPCADGTPPGTICTSVWDPGNPPGGVTPAPPPGGANQCWDPASGTSGACWAGVAAMAADNCYERKGGDCMGGAGGGPANKFTLGLRQPGQTFNQCMQANAGNYSLLGVADFATGANGKIADNALLGFTPASNMITTIYNAAAGSLISLFQTGPTVVTAGMGTVLTSGRRTSSIMSLNLPGTPGGSAGGAPALGSAPSNAARAGKAAAAALKIAIDAGFFLAEGAGCAGPMNY